MTLRTRTRIWLQITIILNSAEDHRGEPDLQFILAAEMMLHVIFSVLTFLDG